MNPWIKPGHPLVIAHRGYSRVAPENTLLAYSKAIEVGADMVEMDINLTKDGEMVMIHDHFLERTTNGKGLVQDYTLEELKKLDAGFYFQPKVENVRIPTAEESIQLIKEAGVLVCFEIKGGNPERACLIAEKLIQLFRKYDAFDWANTCSYHPEAVALAKRLAPELVTSRERLPDDSPFDVKETIKQANECDSPIVLSDYKILKPGDIDDLHKAGIAMWTWNPFELADIHAVIDQHTDGVMGDNPEAAREIVDSM
ncbi:MAG: hypothetical protein J7K66_02550 [Anaerolineaceae bacterium]|nr:hypothetical protein [Anaerolineaceae bacterium]